jgi:predicted membrane protein
VTGSKGNLKNKTKSTNRKRSRTMKKIITLIALVCFTAGVALAQEYKLAKSSGRLEIIEVNNVIIEGYSGDEIVFTSRSRDREDDERAKGLRSISNMGIEDNTGLGLSVLEKGGIVEVRQLKKTDGPKITIKVPKGVVVSYAHTSPYGDDVEFRNIESEIEVSTVHSEVILNNVTGPMTVKTVHGDIEATLSATMKSPLSIVSVHGHVDVAMPVSTKANLKLGTAYGEIFVDPDFKIEIEKTGNMVRYSDNVSGKINGGGLDITLSSSHNNVYLRKKQ